VETGEAQCVEAEEKQCKK